MELIKIQAKNKAMEKEFIAEMKELEKEMKDEKDSDQILHPDRSVALTGTPCIVLLCVWLIGLKHLML